MKILFIRPAPNAETIGLQHVMLVEPLELEILAATCAEGDEPVIVDMILERRPIEYYLKKHRPDLLAVTGYITNVPEMIGFCAAAKRFNPHTVTVVGGVHVEVVPEDLDNIAIDWRIVRNGATAFPRLLAYLRGESPLPKEAFPPNARVDFDTLPPFDFAYPLPRRDLTATYRARYFYIFHEKVALIKTAFGCPYKCSFCFCRMITQDTFRQRPLDAILDELETIDEREIYIVDDDFLVTPARLTAFLDGLTARGIDKHFLIYGRSDFIVNNEQLIERFERQGLRTVIVGFESFNDEELKAYNKQNDVATNEAAMAILNGLGVDCYATVIIPPHWGDEDFERLGDKLVELDIKYVNLQPLTPIPGTGFEVDPEKLVIHRSDFAKWDLAHISITPEKMSVPQFYRKIIKLYERVLYRPSVMKNHLKYPLNMLFKMLKGSYLVHRQYVQKYKEALKDG